MNILDKIILAAYINFRSKTKTEDVALFCSQSWATVIIFIWYILFESILKKHFHFQYGILSLNKKFIILIHLFSLIFLIIKSQTKKADELEQLYIDEVLHHLHTWKYIYLPIIIPLLIFYYSIIKE